MNSITLANWSRVLLAAGVFVAWTLTSFLCHECSKKFLMVSETLFVSAKDPQDEGRLSYYRLFAAAAVTTVQCCSCLLLTRMDTNMFQSRTMTILTISHVLATLATNYSMVFIEAASTLAIKLMEPITMAIAHHVVFRKMVSIQTIISIPLTVYGALIFTGVKSNKVSDTAGIGLAFASNIILAVRNITLKKIQHESTTHSSSLTLKPWPQIAFVIYVQGLFVAGMYVLDSQGFTVKQYPQLVTLVTASGVFHVAYSYISTNIILKVMNVVSHSIANIFKRLLVVLLLSVLGTRQLSASNFLGLGIAVAGLLVYTHSKIGVDQQSYVNIEDNKRCKVRNRRTWLTVLPLAIFTVIIFHSAGQSEWVSKHLASVRQRLYRQADSNFHCLQEVGGTMDDFSHIAETETDPDMRDFLSWRLVDHPEDTDKRSKKLTTNKELIAEAQRILVNLIEDLLGKARHVMLIDIPVHENKGDPAIAAGEILLLEKLNKTIIFHCKIHSCNRPLSLNNAINVSKSYPKDDLVILIHGGGNIVGYTGFDIIRRKYIEAFPDRKCIIFSQSIWLHGNYSKMLEFARQTYSNRSNLVIFLRDRQSLEIAKENFKGVKLILAPDLAFCIGMIPRQMPPLYDILWLRREDGEKSTYTLPTIPDNITVYVGDWRKWLTNRSNKTLEDVFLIASAGFQFLQRGRIVVTDRLHGHILSTLLNIPHVIIDNPPYLKLSSFDKTWTQGLSNTILVSNGSQAVDAALQLLRSYQNSLPSIDFIRKSRD